MANNPFSFGQNMVGQEPWGRRGENDGRIQSLETSRTADEATLALVQTGAWTAYAAVLSGSTANPTLGSGSSSFGRYVRIGRTVIVHAEFFFGSSGTAAGTGYYLVNLPVVPVAASFQIMSTWQAYQGGNTAMAVVSQDGSGTSMRATYPATWPAGTETVVGAASPWVWGANASMRWLAIYEGAS